MSDERGTGPGVPPEEAEVDAVDDHLAAEPTADPDALLPSNADVRTGSIHTDI